MKIARTVLIIAALLCFALPSFAVDAFMAFDVANQQMYVVVRSAERDETLIADVTFSQEDTSGYIGDTCNIEQPGPDQMVAQVCMGPISGAGRAVDDGHENVIVATVMLYTGADRSERTDEIIIRDTLVAHVDPYTSQGYYTYRAETGCQPVMPTNIPISSSFCAQVCHGSYVIPIVCENPGYYPDLLEVTVTNGCAPGNTHCNVSCPQINWGVFNWYKRVLPGCRLYLVMTYCLADPGCVCIYRSDFYLPVEILGFAQTAGDHQVRLNWSTASETDIESYIITRSTVRDGIYEEVHAEAAANSTNGRNYAWTDRNVENGQTYYYKLLVKDADGTHVYHVNNQPVILEATPRAGADAELPMEYSIAQNYPNPFNSQTSFTFSIPEAGHVTLRIFDLLGREVATVVDQNMDVNTYTVNWSATGLPTGVYMYTLTSGEFSQTKKMLYLK